jgi:cell wall-associated NlpC family hydrolase
MCPGSGDYICCSGVNPGPSPSGGGAKIAKAAESMVGKYPYSWGGGNENGATRGIKQEISPYCDDRNVVGFDCSGLALYSVYQGTGKSIDHYSQSQYDDAPKYPLSQRQPGDLVFFGSDSQSIHHVAIYVGNNQMVEAPGHNSDCSGIYVRKRDLRTSDIIQKVGRYWK